MEESSGMVEAHESASAQLWKERSPVVMELEGKMAVGHKIHEILTTRSPS